MKFVVIGVDGKMGKEIKKAAVKNGDFVIAGVDVKEKIDENVYLSLDEIHRSFDAVIDFSTAPSREKFVKYCHMYNIPYGCFATNLTEHDMNLLKALSKKVPVLICSNASKGVNVMNKIVNNIAEDVSDSDVVLTEYHHKQKIDSPSGTARNLLQILLNNKIEAKVVAHRVGTENGKHILEFFWDNESLTIIHQANSKEIFAKRAIELMHKLISKENS